MEGEESILDALHEENDFDDVEMLDVEDGELVGQNLQDDHNREENSEDISVTNQESQNRKRRRRGSKKKNKRRKSAGDANIGNIDRFVSDTCRRLREKKSYMVYTAVGCLGFSALCDLIKEVEAIQSCGGQMTADGRRFRTGGGILWSIIKARDPKAYKEIMAKAKDFEKQFKRPEIIRQRSEQGKHGSSQIFGNAPVDENPYKEASSDLQLASEKQNPNQQSSNEEKRLCVHDRLRKPVSYDDELLGGDMRDDAT